MTCSYPHCDCGIQGCGKPAPREFPDVTHQIDLSELRYLIDHTQNEELSKAFEKLWEAVNQNADHAFMLIKVNS